ncbi:hypothetical protein BLNAU_15819 [Blattamonas nauphoetae]|uniref:Uncharacterized protein n=1 Tax=Blattamonas nauphoetae TaxID=2049346 RepID=A0ABQ9XBD2_9EUKA|nr:hypothetical protein BLNAU_15819 [Blattamonas nauphoetae]
MKKGSSTFQSSGIHNFDDLIATAAEKNPAKRFNKLLASFSDQINRNHRQFQLSLDHILQRHMWQIPKDKRRDLLIRFGAILSQRDIKVIDIESLKKIESSDEDVITLFHTSGLSLSILQQIQPNQTKNRRPVHLAQLSEIFPLVSIEPISEDLSSFFRTLLCDPLPYLEKDDTNSRSSFSALLDILCNEVMACVILGIGNEVFETIVTNFPAFSEAVSRRQTERDKKDFELSTFRKIVEISQNCMDPVERIAAFIKNLPNKTMSEDESDGQYHMNLLSQCLQHSVTFLNAHPDLVDSFFETVDLSSSPSNILFRHDRHLSLLSTLSQSSSPLFTKLSESLLGPKFNLLSVLSPRSFTDPASSFFRIARTNPAFFHRFIENHTRRLLDLAVSTAVMTVRVVSDSSSEPHCLDFGRGTENWVVLLKAIADLKMDVAQPSKQFNLLMSPLLTLLILSAASTNDELSTVAVTVISNKFGLSTKQAETLLCATPTTFPVNPSFTRLPQQRVGASDRPKDPCQSICAEAGQTRKTVKRILSSNRPQKSESGIDTDSTLSKPRNAFSTPRIEFGPARSVFGAQRTTPLDEDDPAYVTPFEQSIVEKLRTAEGEERWRLVTQLAVVSSDGHDFAEELMKAENDAQALLVLSVHTIRSTPRVDLHLDSNPAAFDRVVEFAGHLHNLPLIAAAIAHIGDTVEALIVPVLARKVYHIEPKQELCELVFNALRLMAARRQEEVEERMGVGKDEMTSQIVGSCLKVFRMLLCSNSFDPTPFVDFLVTLAVTTDLSQLRSILVVLQEIEDRTRNTTSPFSLSTATAPFRERHQSSVTQQPLPSIVSSILLSARLDPFQMVNYRKNPPPTPALFGVRRNTDDAITLTQLLPGLNEKLIYDIAKETAKMVCVILEERRASSSRALKSDDPFEISLAQENRHTRPQQLFIILHALVLPQDPDCVAFSQFIPLAPFLTRILTIVVPSSPDGPEIRSPLDEHSQLLTIELHPLSPQLLSPLSSLLSVLSIALVRLDRIPSSLHLHDKFRNLFEQRENRSNPQLAQIVLALCSEGMEDRSDLALDSFSLKFLDLWKGANTQHHVERRMPIMARAELPFVPFIRVNERQDTQNAGGFIQPTPRTQQDQRPTFAVDSVFGVLPHTQQDTRPTFAVDSVFGVLPHTQQDQRPTGAFVGGFGVTPHTQQDKRPTGAFVGGFGDAPHTQQDQRPTSAFGGGFGDAPRTQQDQRPTSAVGGGFGDAPHTQQDQRPTSAVGGVFGDATRTDTSSSIQRQQSGSGGTRMIGQIQTRTRQQSEVTGGGFGQNETQNQSDGFGLIQLSAFGNQQSAQVPSSLPATAPTQPDLTTLPAELTTIAIDTISEAPMENGKTATNQLPTATPLTTPRATRKATGLGQVGQTTPVFGKANKIGQAGPTAVFGTTSGFGQAGPTTAGIGKEAPKQSVFGQPAPKQTGFGQTLHGTSGKPQPESAFGNQKSNTGSAFGPQQQSGGGRFGNAQGSVFGNQGDTGGVSEKKKESVFGTQTGCTHPQDGTAQQMGVGGFGQTTFGRQQGSGGGFGG